ncbi:MAG: hypothetical protein HYZ14_12290 [Bacteroidetes bacterium]|nr:hypothetical protein [Bacteroidota bacterium]
MYNLIAYLLFLTAMSIITVHLGRVFYKNGAVYIHMLLPQDPHLVASINKLLLAGYYLLNLGYVVMNIAFWSPVETVEQMCSTLFFKAGTLILFLALMHYLNLFWLLLFSRKQRHTNTTMSN